MKQSLQSLLVASLLSIVGIPVSSQSAQEQGISNSTQILETSVLFAIGAREAEQAIRGSFGWPTFQEGFVDKVYFRFDPDGYARFSSSPRLDEDVFEVICAESSTACLAKKPNIQIGLTPNGQIQLQVSGITPQDSFHVSDRKSELPLPPTVLEPLDARLETLLASSVELIVKRELEVIQTISLSGFSAVATYLRWVAQNQNPRVFPRGWPVPAQGIQQQTSGLTQPNLWETPNSGPQVVETTYSQQVTTQDSNQPFDNFRSGRSVQNGQVSAFNQNGSSNVSNALESQIQDLQNQISQLQNVSTPSRDDFGQGFAQQARGRSLVEVSGFTDIDIAPNATRDQGFQQQIPTESTLQAAQFSPSQLSEYYTAVENIKSRIFVIEKAIIEDRNKFYFEIEKLRQLVGENTKPYEVKAITQDQKIDSVSEMSSLEKLLLQQIREVEVTPDIQPISEQSVDQSNTEHTQRDIIVKLLNELSEEHGMVEESVEHSQAAQKSVRKEGFVSLSDYINQVFQAESAKTE